MTCSSKHALPMITSSQRICGECHECCIAYPLLPDPAFWPNGKRNQTPCQHLCAAGCAIHDAPRPSVCTDFTCGWLDGVGGDVFRPDRCGFILALADFFRAFLSTDIEEQCLYYGRPPDADAITMKESRPQALLAMPASKIKYACMKRKFRRGMPLVSIMPYNVDPYVDYPTRAKPRLFPEHLVVWWQGTPDYAEELHRWWLTT